MDIYQGISNAKRIGENAEEALKGHLYSIICMFMLNKAMHRIAVCYVVVVYLIEVDLRLW